MNWSAWFLKSNLHPSLAHEYGLLFSMNELGEDDLEQLSHEFLLSMGISIGKHRLEILKMARRGRSQMISSSAKRLSSGVAKHAQALVRGSISAIAVALASLGASGKKLLRAKKAGIMVANGSLAVYDYRREGSGVSALIRWDSMFQDLNPT